MKTKKDLNFKHGVWYKNEMINDFILLYRHSHLLYTGYFNKMFAQNKWNGFSSSESWHPATLDELRKLGTEWEAYPWIEHKDVEMKEKARKNYKYAVIRFGQYRLLVIEDLKIPDLISVTNDIDNIYDHITIKENDLLYNTDAMVFYKASNDIWDQYNPKFLKRTTPFNTHNFKDLSQVIEYWEQNRNVSNTK